MTSPRSLGLWENGVMLSSNPVQLACSAGGKVGPPHLLGGYADFRSDLRLGFLGSSSLQPCWGHLSPSPHLPGRQSSPEVAVERVQQDHLTPKDSPSCPQCASERVPAGSFCLKWLVLLSMGSAPPTPNSMDYGPCAGLGQLWEGWGRARLCLTRSLPMRPSNPIT